MINAPQEQLLTDNTEISGKLLQQSVICHRVKLLENHVPFLMPQDGPPFSATGVDFTGAMCVKNEETVDECTPGSAPGQFILKS